jgi:hypothetical protein
MQMQQQMQMQHQMQQQHHQAMTGGMGGMNGMNGMGMQTNSPAHAPMAGGLHPATDLPGGTTPSIAGGEEGEKVFRTLIVLQNSVVLLSASPFVAAGTEEAVQNGEETVNASGQSATIGEDSIESGDIAGFEAVRSPF